MDTNFPYDDIVNLPHPTSKKHPRMSMEERAAQFSPFAALTGFGAVLQETGRLTGSRRGLTDSDIRRLEEQLTWLAEHPQKYNLGECEFHLAFRTDDFEAAHKLHQEMGCICFENPKMGIYFIQDPDGYWLEIVPVRK